ncbi:MAG: homoserine kinase [bacterium ADurb.Bin425]|nr:MAG: homoserine kinase [bacterium ADurb.Bin425]
MTIEKPGLDTICGAFFHKPDLNQLAIKTVKEGERYLVQDLAENTFFMLGCEETSRSKTALEQERQLLLIINKISCERQEELALPLLQLSKDQKPWFQGKDRLWTLRRYVPGISFDWRGLSANLPETESEEKQNRLSCLQYQSFCQRAGEELARLHNLSFIGESQALDQRLDLSLTVDYRQACLTRLRAQAEKTSISLGELEAILEPLIDAAVAKQERLSREKKLPAVLIHGDFHPGNFRLTEQGAAGIIDWDFSRFDSPLFDLLYSLFMFGGSFRQGKTTASLLDQTKSEAFLAGYFAAINADLKQTYQQSQIDDERALAVLALTLILIFELDFESKFNGSAKKSQLEQVKSNQEGLIKNLQMLALEQEAGKSLIHVCGFS